MSINIRQVIELQADLNHYYPQFPSSLRKQIDAAVIALASGEQKLLRNTAHRSVEERRRRVGAFSGGLPGDTVMRMTDKRPRVLTSFTARVVAELRRHGSELLLAEVRELVRNCWQEAGKEISPARVNTDINNLVRDGYIAVDGGT